MRIGLVSDTHDSHANIIRALAQLRLDGISTILHAGDVTAAHTLRLFKSFDVWIARGNMDHDTALTHAAQQLFGPGRLRDRQTLSLDGVTIAVVHNGQSDAARELVTSRSYDYVIVGHSHRQTEHLIGRTRVINPGALGGTLWHRPSFATLDLTTGVLTRLEI